MELTLTHEFENRVAVLCNGQLSHTFERINFPPVHEKGPSHPPTDPVSYGRSLFDALFPPQTLARWTLEQRENTPGRILLGTIDDTLDAIPWEYTHTGEDFLVLEHHFVRGLPEGKRISPPQLDSGLHIVAIPSHPLSHNLEALNIEGEWTRLKDIIKELPSAIILERCHPPTLERLGLQVAHQRHRILHFMGHGGQDEKEGAVLCFEQDNGSLDLVNTKDFTRQIRDTVFLVTLNACSSATASEPHLSNLAAALMKQKTPYTLGMRFSIPDEDALTFSRTFYSYLARGSSVEEAVYRTRLAFARSKRPWMVGMLVLYTALAAPAPGFFVTAGTPTIQDRQPEREIGALPSAQGGFQGRIKELQQLGIQLTGDNRPHIITIHGGGGQGKTALAREAVERFAHAWPDGVWATSLENLPKRPVFINTLARFLRIPIQELNDPAEVEQRVLATLSQRRILIVLDNAETLVDAAVKEKSEDAIDLAKYIQQLPGRTVSLLITSRVSLGWAGEVSLELGGLRPVEGRALFQQHAPQRREKIDPVLAWQLSEKVDGHPLSLQLLGEAFNASTLELSAFVTEYEERLLQAERTYERLAHRHRTLIASVETSVHYLDNEHQRLLSKLWLFHAPFLSEWARDIFDPPSEDREAENEDSPVYDQLYTLWQRGLLAIQQEGALLLYRLMPTIRTYVERYLTRADEKERLLTRFGTVYARLVHWLHNELEHGSTAISLASSCQEDLERGVLSVSDLEKGYYLLYWGWILHRLNMREYGLQLTEQALEIGQEQDERLQLGALNNLAGIYQVTGRPSEALRLYQEALPLSRKIGDHDGEVAILNNMAVVYHALGQPFEALRSYQEIGDGADEAVTLNNMAEVHRTLGNPQQALPLYKKALPLSQAIDDHAGEVAILNNMAEVYLATGQPSEALRCCEKALPLSRKIRDRRGEAITLGNMALVYQTTGQPSVALRLYQEALPRLQEIDAVAEQATTLNNIAGIYQAIGQPSKALRRYEEALPLMERVGNRAGKVAVLNGMAEVYQNTGDPQRALRFYQEALPLTREIHDPRSEATTLNNMAGAYLATGEHSKALHLYQEALPLRRQVDDRAGEASTLGGFAMVYRATSQRSKALEHLQRALSLMQQVDDRAGEATILNNTAYLFMEMDRYADAYKAFEQSTQREQAVQHPAGEVVGLLGMALLLYQYLQRQPEAILKVEQAIIRLRQTDLPQDAAGHKLEDIQRLLQTMRAGALIGRPWLMG